MKKKLLGAFASCNDLWSYTDTILTPKSGCSDCHSSKQCNVNNSGSVKKGKLNITLLKNWTDGEAP